MCHSSGEVIVVGWVCLEDHFSLPSRAEFDKARLAKRVKLARECVAVQKAVWEYLITNSEIAAAINDFVLANFFISDVVLNLGKYGSLTERQHDVVIRTASKARQFHQSDPKGVCPEGKALSIQGEIVSLGTKQY